ncbi:hypothetical protein AB9M75_08480 [Lactobacillus sp. AN1001]|nr:hypothetical protein FAX13_04205 [Ligilactobacillus animalis]
MRQTKQEMVEEYLYKKRQFNAQRMELSDRLAGFRRETEQLVAQVMYLTRNDIWDRAQFYRAVEVSAAKVEQAATDYTRYLADREHDATVEYKRQIDRRHDQ